MKVEQKGKDLVITIPLDVEGRASSSGKTMIHASSGGNVATSVIVKGRPLVVGVNCYTKA